LESLLDARGDDYRPPDTGLEARFMQIMRERGVGDFRRQVAIGGDDQWIGRVDFRHAVLPVIVEVQSRRHHAALSYRRDDASRVAALSSAGFEVVEVWDDEVWFAPEAATARIRAALRRAARQAA
jgi:very-short-patch-repair endonuclease